jgi:hypothetical protein
MKKLKLKIEGGPQLTKSEMKKILGSGQICYIACCDENNNFLGDESYSSCPTESTSDGICFSGFAPQQQARLCIRPNSCYCDVY